MSDASGNIVGINSYDEFGIPASTNMGRFQYTGQTWFPELGMYNYKARFYSASMGRFMQTDPIGYADGMNWYNYVGGDPINFVDPTGTDIVVTATKKRLPDSLPDIYVLWVFPSLGPLEAIDVSTITVTAKPKKKEKGKRSKSSQRLDLCGSPGNSQFVPEGIGAASFQTACARHDQFYATHSMSREQCDAQLSQDIADECSKRGGAICYLAAPIYYYGLRLFGGPAYGDP